MRCGPGGRTFIAVNGATVRHYASEALFPHFQRDQLAGILAALSKHHVLMGSLPALDIVLLFGRRHAPPFSDGGGAERSREDG